MAEKMLYVGLLLLAYVVGVFVVLSEQWASETETSRFTLVLRGALYREDSFAPWKNNGTCANC
jgi:hypothetical protein